MEEIVKKQETKSKKNLPIKFLFIFGTILGIILVSMTMTYITVMNVATINQLLGIATETSDTSETSKLVVSEDEASIIEMVKNAQKGVVSIAISQLSLSKDQGIVTSDSNIGTGFIVDATGWIITNQHVVSSTTADYKVVTNDGKQYDVTEIARDDANDIAILKIDAKDLTVLPLGDSDSLMVGQDVVAIGTPLGEYSGSVTKGIISGLDRTVAASSSWYGGTSKTYEGVVQTDAAVNPGNSGGPLLNSQGEVIGVNFATTSGADNISFALPINVVKEKIEEYRTYGKFIKPYLGVSYQMISEFEAYYYANVVAGAFIQSIDTNGPAYAAGLRKGDIITKLGEDDVDTSLSTLIQKHDVGERLEVKYYRNGSEKSTTVTLAEAK
jgi:S1-C subfamily serine protease